ncbi:PPOX class F420-dependent oxidoreductase [Aciditerrimonas ferrireducens]|jgi:PPOX class probable F420-dependent enzyme|uniref:PPOX class F420-dependent oxidoreductase n=1 Tax=Aciditerrimonas ferrireducens TaxID=667306 RepID=A0ABV6C2A5_9ACTN
MALQRLPEPDPLAFAATHHRGVLYTQRHDGGPQLSPVVAAPLDGVLVVSSREQAVKTRNVRRTGWAAICLFEDGFFGRWCQAEGPCDVLSLPEALEPLVAYYRAVAGEHPDWDAYRAAMVAEQRSLLRLRVERAGPRLAG